MKTAGFSLDNGLLKIAVLEGKKAIKAEEASLPKSDEERIRLIRETLLKLKEELGVGAVAFALPLKNFTFHFVDLPVKSAEDVARALPFELEKHLPLPPEEYVWDFHSAKGEGSGSRNLVAAVRRDRLSWISECVKDTGVSLLGVRCAAIEAVNAFVSSGRARTAVFAYKEGSSYLIAGMEDSDPGFFRVFHSAAQAASEAERLGGDIYSPDAPEFKGAKEFTFSTSESAASAGKRALDFDFTPPELIRKRADYYPYAIAAMSLVSMLLFFLTSVAAYYKDYSALRDIKRRIEAVEAEAHGLIDARKELEGIEKKKRFLLDFREGRSVNIAALRQLSALLPESAWLTGFSADDKGKIVIEGYAARAAGIIGPIEKSRTFGNVEFSSPVIVEGEKERFSLSMELETAGGNK